MLRLISFITISICIVSRADAQALDGLWGSEGYGYVFEIKGDGLKTFEVTTQTCLPGFTAKREKNQNSDREVTFRTTDGDEYFVRAGGTVDHRLLHNVGSASDIRIDRLLKLPSQCDHFTANTPRDNFEVFTRTWAEQYISFDLKHADWDQIVSRNRAQVTDETSPTALFGILRSMIEPFGDAHTTINTLKLKLRFHGIRPGTDRLVRDLAGNDGFDQFEKTGMRKILAVTNRAYIRGPLGKFCNDQVQFGRIDDTTGYLRILSFADYSKHGGFEQGLLALEAALDAIFSDPTLKAFVIDVRINFGGYDPYGLVIASRLATREYLAYTKYAREDPVEHDKWTPGDPSIIQPSTRASFHGPVVELTGPLTISGGETFTQALMGRVPHVTRIGENTQGVFSDVLVRRLPNGWFFGLPNEVYQTPGGNAFDGSGIPPDISVPVFSAVDLATSADPAVARALEVLRGNKES